jgi:alkanesulfonate monooxygenase SsuD/methylene tetrahydromethanopterin reductase-like flavin-dependent oxidoreductase (luciferase family)
VQRPAPPILIGGESAAALKRAARLGDGWVGMNAESSAVVAEKVKRLNELRAEAGRADQPFEVCVGGDVSGLEDLERWAHAGVDRLILAPWARSREAVAGLERLADAVGLTPRN